jgi:hypothetical protein
VHTPNQDLSAPSVLIHKQLMRSLRPHQRRYTASSLGCRGGWLYNTGFHDRSPHIPSFLWTEVHGLYFWRRRDQQSPEFPPLFEKAYDSHQITIVPDGPQTIPQDYKFLVWDRGGRWNQPALQDRTPFKAFHGQRLRFQPGNSFRPRARYLYFRYILAMMVHLRYRNVKQGTHDQQLKCQSYRECRRRRESTSVKTLSWP